VEYLDRVPYLEIKLGNYTVRDTFYVVDLSNTDVVLGVEWMITLGKITTNYQTLEMGLRDRDGKKVLCHEKGMSWGGIIGAPLKDLEDSLQSRICWDDINMFLGRFHRGDHLTGGLSTPLSWMRGPNLLSPPLSSSKEVQG
jgi:hypothetical protein